MSEQRGATRLVYGESELVGKMKGEMRAQDKMLHGRPSWALRFGWLMCHRYAYSGLFMKWDSALAAQCLLTMLSSGFQALALKPNGIKSCCRPVARLDYMHRPGRTRGSARHSTGREDEHGFEAKAVSIRNGASTEISVGCRFKLSVVT